jgi:hypothetical protein
MFYQFVSVYAIIPWRFQAGGWQAAYERGVPWKKITQTWRKGKQITEWR